MSEDSVEDSIDASFDDAPPILAEITVNGPGVSITRQVDETTMGSVIALLFGAAPAALAGLQGGTGVGRDAQQGTSESGASGRTGSTWDARMTLVEFLTDTGATTFPQKFCATGYYLTEIKGAKDFSRDEVKSALLTARENMPGNYNRDWGQAISSSLIAAESHDANRFYVPRTGRTAVESRFKDVPKRRTRRTAKKANSSPAGDAE